MSKRNLIVAATVLVFMTSSCKKDSFNMDKMIGSWVVEEYRVASVDLLTDSLSITIDGGTVKTKFSSASIVFDEDGDFIENIAYGAVFNDGSSSYTVAETVSSGSGLWSCIDSDLLLSFETSYDPNSSSYDYLTMYSSPLNSIFFTGEYYGRTTTERYDILKLTKSEIEMEGINSANQSIFIRATKN
jgi:hypothetical protein